MKIRELSAGKAIKIVKTFQDGGGTEFPAGTILHFKSRDFSPYHEGHTVNFIEAPISLCDLDATNRIVENAHDEYFELYKEA